MAEYKGILICGELAGEKLSGVTAELLNTGRKLSDELNQPLSLLLVGKNINGAANEAIPLGADKVYVADTPLLKDYQTDAYLAVMDKVAKQVNPHIIVTGQTSVGRDLIPRLAFRLDTAAITDCVGLEIDSGSKELLLTKPVYGGNAQATFTSESYPQIATVRAKAMSPLERDESRQGEVITIEAS